MENIDRGFNNPFIALRHRNFSLYMAGMSISLVGTWMQNVAQPWLAYSLTKSPLLLSLVGIMQFLPMMIFSLFAGVIVDRISKKKLLLFTQSASLVITLVLAILVWTGREQYWHILVAATALGFVNTLDMPTRQSFVIEMVGKEDLTNAIAINSSVFNIARVVGPAVAGLVMGYAGVAVCFLINSVSFAAVVISLLFIKPISCAPVPKTANVTQCIKEGLQHIAGNRTLIVTMLALFVVGAFGMNTNVLVPVFAKAVLNQQETGFGLLMSFVGVGSFLGAMFVAAMSRRGPSNIIVKAFPLLVAVFLFFVALAKSFALTAIGLAALGFSFVAFSSTANSLLQMTTDDEYRGRVMSVFALALGGSTPIGNFFSGLISEHFGAPIGFAACGAVVLVLSLLLLVWDRSKKPSKPSD